MKTPAVSVYEARERTALQGDAANLHFMCFEAALQRLAQDPAANSHERKADGMMVTTSAKEIAALVSSWIPKERNASDEERR